MENETNISIYENCLIITKQMADELHNYCSNKMLFSFYISYINCGARIIEDKHLNTIDIKADDFLLKDKIQRLNVICSFMDLGGKAYYKDVLIFGFTNLLFALRQTNVISEEESDSITKLWYNNSKIKEKPFFKLNEEE
ncbi:MAG: hypothetical protein MJZ24_07855 [Paludibacteraceae bacterium]|nr:hypothetical protein [Paludibacteraceae bacterium]